MQENWEAPRPKSRGRLRGCSFPEICGGAGGRQSPGTQNKNRKYKNELVIYVPAPMDPPPLSPPRVMAPSHCGCGCSVLAVSNLGCTARCFAYVLSNKPRQIIPKPNNHALNLDTAQLGLLNWSCVWLRLRKQDPTLGGGQSVDPWQLEAGTYLCSAQRANAPPGEAWCLLPLSSAVGLVLGTDKGSSFHWWTMASSYGSHDVYANVICRLWNMMEFFENHCMFHELRLFLFCTVGFPRFLAPSEFH